MSGGGRLAPAPGAARTATVAFRGGRDREGPLAWAQMGILRELVWLGEESHTYNENVRVAVEPGTDLAGVLDAVRAMTELHEGLRTTIVSPADPVPRQRVHGAGELSVRLVEGTPESAGCPDGRHNFDMEREWPVRWTIFCREGRPVELMAVICHIAVDGTALMVIRQELTRLLPPRAERGPAGPVWQPLDQAEWETVHGAQTSRAAVERWVRLVDEAPREMFEARYPASGAGDFECYEMRSVAAAVALQRIAQRLRVSTSTVLVGLTAATVARLGGHRRVVFKVVVGNRVDERLRGHIAPMVQDGIVSLDADGGFATVVKRAWPAAVRAYSKARYDPAELARALAGYSAGRGADGDPRVALNDARFTDNWRDLPDVPDGAALWALRGRTEISHLFSQDRVDVKFFVEVLQAVDCLRLTLLTDGRCVPADRIPAILRDMEETLVREAAPGG